MRRQYKTAKSGGGGGEDMERTYFYVEDVSGSDNTLQIYKSNNTYIPTVLFSYSYDALTWSEPFEVVINTTVSITVPANRRVYLRGNNTALGYLNVGYTNINCEKSFDVGGNIFSLIVGDGINNITEYEFSNAMFFSLLMGSKISSAEMLFIPDVKSINSQYSFAEMFAESSITQLPSILFCSIQTVGTGVFSGFCRSCELLKELPEGIFGSVEKVGNNSFSSVFASCSLLERLPDGIFSKVRDISYSSSAFSSAFNKCDRLRKLPDDIFSLIGDNGGRNSVNSSYTFQGTFKQCRALEELPDNIFDEIKVVRSAMFYSTFEECNALASLPPNLFSKIISATQNTFRFCFYKCAALTTLPKGIFSNITGVGSYSFAYCFQNTGITELPDDIFSLVTDIGNSSFRFVFAYTKIHNFPKGLFSNIVSCSNSYSLSSFANSLPIEEGVDFRNLTTVGTSTFVQAYANCVNISKIYAPNVATWNENVFKNWVQNVGASGTFYKPKGLEIPVGESGIPEGWTVVEYE